ncbi:MAG TPA: UDP-4-amino-4,6-dideoxy-N-acetyl-beta-L-altrosamine transaminase [Gemmataceae bacterium]|nr:UDP-4-amino-4,6-dideoxy-N-acetyl-beta-L-altrosamine transaminase [Gemmataceae bacterium]
MTTLNHPVETTHVAVPLPPLPYSRQWLDEDDIDAVVRVLRGDWLTQGPVVGAFEKALAETCGARYAVAVSSGTAALHVACLAAGVGPGDVGVTSPITFVASANCIACCGGTPCFADIDPATVTLDPAALEEVCVQRKPKVVIPVDFAGQPADLPAIQAVARRHGALVIEDAAHSLGASYEHEGAWYKAGSSAHADMAVLSFHPVKHITTGEGGAVLTNSPELYDRLQRLRTHGITRDPALLTHNDGPWYYEQHDLGYNYRITDIQCALGLSQLKKLSRFVERRRRLVERYREVLADLAGDVDLLVERPGRRSSYHLLVARLRGGAERRRQVFEALAARGIRCQVHYIPVHLQPWYRAQLGWRPGTFTSAEAYYESCVSLPLFPAMSDGDVERVADALRLTMRKD